MNAQRSTQVYEVRPRSAKCGFDLISDALPFGRLWYVEPNAISKAIGYANFFSHRRGSGTLNGRFKKPV